MSRFQQTGHALNQADREKLMAATGGIPTLPAGAPSLPAAGGQVARLGKKYPSGLGRPRSFAVKHRLEPGVGLAHVVQTGRQGQVLYQWDREADTLRRNGAPTPRRREGAYPGGPVP